MFSKGKAMLWQSHIPLTKDTRRAIRRNMGKKSFALMTFGVLMTSGCVQVTAPDKPIVINLNIAIRQEILYKLDEASKKVINENPEIF
jgi:YnbE-like lipoprotein